jgi:hypothetical protein
VAHGGPDYSISTTGGVGLIMIGVAFPALPAPDELFYRTDLDLLCRWDGARWLTENEYVFITNGTTIAVPMRTDFYPYIKRCAIISNVAAPNNGANCWTIYIVASDIARVPAVSWHLVTTAADAAGVNVMHDGNAGTPLLGINYPFMEIVIGSLGAPGVLTFYAAIYYRLVIT